MITVSKADKNRLTIRGLVNGAAYVVSERAGGWLVVPEKKHRVRRAGMSAGQFAELHEARPRLDAATAAEIASNIQAHNQAQ